MDTGGVAVRGSGVTSKDLLPGARYPGVDMPYDADSRSVNSLDNQDNMDAFDPFSPSMYGELINSNGLVSRFHCK